MQLVENTEIPVASLPLAEFRAHLRLGSGFGEETLQDSVLEGFLRAAIAAVEARTGKVLLQRSFDLTLAEWRDQTGQVLPVAPVSAVLAVQLVNEDGGSDTLASDRYRLDVDQHHPVLRPTAAILPMVASGGHVLVTFEAGFGEEWTDVPVDLGQAVMMLAAHFYEYRHETALSGGCMPFGVTSLIERHRPLRIGLGGQA
jgi:uncharacterized phiE125 gp8 family phage protein